MSKINYNTGEYIVVYIYSIPNLTTHRNHLKIGKTSIKFADYANAADKDEAVKNAAHERIRGDLLTAEINYELEYYTLAINNKGKSFFDHDVHNVLKRSGKQNIKHIEDKKGGEWFDISIDTAVRAIEAVKNGRSSLNADEIVIETSLLELRKGSQTDALAKTLKAIEKGKKNFLWDAKMRFGKTLAALEVARKKGYGKVLIITHRPEVNDDWFNDFNKLFTGTDYRFGSRDKGESITNLQNKYIKRANNEHANPFVYFASIQYLRHEVKSQEKLSIMNEKWDMLIVDEADEGIKTTLADETISQIQRDFTLMLSGTPFNLLEDYNEDEIYTWDYTAEQELKEKWDELYPDEPNPYYKLPRLSIFTYELNKYIEDSHYIDLYNKAFNFKEFFRTDESGEFIHGQDIRRFLDLITTKSENNFPYSTEEYRKNLRHTLWMVPGVKEARALEKLLGDHPIFRNFKIANVAGDGNEEVAERKSRKLVKQAITERPMDNYSITISCGKMTRGVSVPEWTAVFMLNNISKASTYLQTIFRGQTPWEYEGQLKSECFVFDFAPDRTLKVVAEVMNIKKKRPTTEEVKEATRKFLNYCSVISATHGAMQPFSTQKLLQAIKKVAIQKVTHNGFDDPRLYNIENLEKCSDEELADFAELNKIVGQSRGAREDNKIKMADNGFTDEEHEQVEEAERKKKQKKELTPEEQELLRRKKEIAEQRKTRISILRGISIRMPMLIYGCKIDQNGKEIKADDEITLTQFIDNVDDESWAEFMPEGVSKEMLRDKFAKYYDDEVFVGAGIDIRLRALAADQLSPSERVMEIGEIFKGFKNPDKETVLTPWRVVNMHISSTLGGADFNNIIEYGEGDDKEKNLGLPDWVDNDYSSKIWENKQAKILEINSKSGLYPLLCAYNFYSRALPEAIKNAEKTEDELFRELWNEILSKNIYVLTKSPMAKTITERTLAGYTNSTTNVIYIKDLINKLKKVGNYKDYELKDDLNNKFRIGESMKFNVVVGNPPYQEQKGGTKNIDIWQYFIFNATKYTELMTIIHPGRWVIPKKQMARIRDELIDIGLKEFDYYPNSNKLFPTVTVDGGITISVIQKNYSGEIKYSVEGTPFGVYVKNEKFISNEYEKEALKKLSKLLETGNTMQKRIYGNIGSLGGGEYGYSKTEHLSYLRNTPIGLKEPIKIWANSGSGKGARFDWHYIDKKYLNKIPDIIQSTRKVMIDKKGHSIVSGKGNIINNKPIIVEKEVVSSGDVLFVIPEKDERYDLSLICSLFTTKTARFLMSITQKDLYVRGFENIPDYTLFKPLLGGKLLSDKWLYEYFNFSAELINHIESNVSSKY